MPKLIFVHGGNGSADSYQEMVDVMQECYNCYGIDYLKEVTLEPENSLYRSLPENMRHPFWSVQRRKNPFSWQVGVWEEPFVLKLPAF